MNTFSNLRDHVSANVLCKHYWKKNLLSYKLEGMIRPSRVGDEAADKHDVDEGGSYFELLIINLINFVKRMDLDFGIRDDRAIN